jgi:hypothetical protein
VLQLRAANYSYDIAVLRSQKLSFKWFYAVFFYSIFVTAFLPLQEEKLPFDLVNPST